jgi:DNA repair exonuclease SbcCD nuclease subunit
MKRLFFSDVHFNTWSYGATVTKDGFNSRLMQQYKAACDMVIYAEEHGIEYVYFTGDLFHTHGNVPTQALQLASDIFRQLRQRGIKIRAIPGNHDMADKHGHIHALNFLPQDERGVFWEDDGGINVHAMPYTTDEEKIKRFLGNVGEGNGSIVLLHQGVAGVPLSSGYLLDEKLNPEMIPDNCVAFTGHYHFHKVVSPHLTVVGNLTPLNWSDIDQPKGFIVWDEDKGGITRVIQQKSPVFISWNDRIEKHSDLTNVEGAFVRYTSPVKPAEMVDVRERLMDAGALQVQFSNMETDKGETEIRSGDQMTIVDIVEQYDDATEGRRREVGVEIRENTYASSQG